jgi:peptidyl-prolyl cis-trans isomerase C
MLLKSRILMIGAASMLTLSACNKSDQPKDATPSKTAVIATVNGVNISENRLDMVIKQRQDQPDTPEMRKEMVDQLTIQLLLSQEAVKKGLNKTPDVADQVDFAQQSILANAYIRDYLKSTPVSDDMLKAEYEKIKGQMGGNEYKARHILVENEADAKDIIAKLKKNPKLFAALAKEKSKDAGSKMSGGDLGWFDARRMVPEFGDAVAKLAKNQYTEIPVKSQFGYHIIMLEDTRAKTIPPLEQVKSGLQQQVQQQNVKKLIDELKSKAKINIVQISPAKEIPPAKKPAEQGK